jgi:hypothetical protein
MADQEIQRNRWNVEGGSSLLGSPGKIEMFPFMGNSNHDPRKNLPIRKTDRSGAGQSKVV